ncbi:unnamed protein product [Urochloa humidicola]
MRMPPPLPPPGAPPSTSPMPAPTSGPAATPTAVVPCRPAVSPTLVPELLLHTPLPGGSSCVTAGRSKVHRWTDDSPPTGKTGGGGPLSFMEALLAGATPAAAASQAPSILSESLGRRYAGLPTGDAPHCPAHGGARAQGACA